MARPKTDNKNELRTRVNDRVYDGVQQYIAANRCSSEARAISDLLEIALFGTIGSMPTELVNQLYGISQSETKTLA